MTANVLLPGPSTLFARRCSRPAGAAGRALVAAVAVLVLSGCTGPASRTAIPAEPPYIRGVITSLEETRMQVEEVPEQPSGSAKSILRLAPSTVILWGSGEAAGPRDLRLGAQVRVWVAGPVLESYPTQATAGTVVIDVGSLQVDPQA